MKHFLNSSACLALAVGLAGFAPAALAQEQEAPSAEGGIAEIVVTAQHRAESLQKTPISVAALTSDAIEARGITSVAGLQSEVPNLQMTPLLISAES